VKNQWSRFVHFYWWRKSGYPYWWLAPIVQVDVNLLT